MSSDIPNMLRDMSSLFARLADQFEKEHNAINARLYNQEGEIARTKNTLKSVAETIFKNLN